MEAGETGTRKKNLLVVRDVGMSQGEISIYRSGQTLKVKAGTFTECDSRT
jgi:hypothetical protein